MQHLVCRDGVLATRLGQLAPAAAAHALRAVANAVAREMEAAVLPAPGPAKSMSINVNRFSELGGLLLLAHVRCACDTLTGIPGRGTSGGVRSCFGRLRQAARLLSMRAIGDVYNVAESAPALSQEEVLAVLAMRSDFSPAAIGSLQTARLRCFIGAGGAAPLSGPPGGGSA